MATANDAAAKYLREETALSSLNFDNLQNSSKHQVETITAFATTMSKGMQEIAAESVEYSKQSMTAGSEVFQKMLGAKTLESAIQIQTDYAKSAYEAFVARTTKINEIISKVASEAMKPAQSAFSATAQKAQTAQF